MKNKNSGITLIELLIVISILAILAAMICGRIVESHHPKPSPPGVTTVTNNLFTVKFDLASNKPSGPIQIQYVVMNESLSEFIAREPDSLFKANLLVVAGAHAAGEDERLGSALQMYALKSLTELELIGTNRIKPRNGDGR